ncbi:27 kDa hemolymph protein-like [Culicoides brevitarsis]|uniref:27 kDa hemolymph protein-like n=1 Tax=Culicoides brevitarsis TaxID=469753 RepID=UPI00307B58CF
MKRLSAVLFIVLIHAISLFANDNELDLEKVKDKIKEIDIDKIKAQLPEGVKIPPELLNASLPSVEETTKILKEKCIKVSGSDAAYEEAAQGGMKLNECITGLVDVSVLQEEIEKATPTGDLDTVFNKYCRKRDTAIACVTNFTETIDPCLEPQERENKKIMIDIFTSLVNFVCHKDGDQIALFISEKGPECFKEKQGEVLDCVNSTFKGYMPAETPQTIDDLPILTFGEKECSDMSKLQKCVVHVLEDCQESTPANLVDAMFRFVRNKTPCVNMTSKADKLSEDNDTGSSVTFTSSVVVIAVASVFAMFA